MRFRLSVSHPSFGIATSYTPGEDRRPLVRHPNSSDANAIVTFDFLADTLPAFSVPLCSRRFVEPDHLRRLVVKSLDNQASVLSVSVAAVSSESD